MNFELMAESFPKLIGGIPDTLMLVVSSLALGFIFAVILAQMRLSKSLILSKSAYAYVYVFRSTPLLVQIFLIYYGSGQFREPLESVFDMAPCCPTRARRPIPKPPAGARL